ncbi:MAG: ABC transporter permease [Actinomycetota bacterium]
MASEQVQPYAGQTEVVPNGAASQGDGGGAPDPGAAPRGRSSVVPILRTTFYKLRRLAAVLLLVTFATFALLDLLPGDPAVAIVGEGGTPEQIERVRQDLELDRPMPVRYVSWLGDVATGDLGRSHRTGQPVWQAIEQRLPVSLQLMAVAQILALAFALPLGIAAAYRPGSFLDRASMGSGYALVAMPPFILGMLLIVIFSGWLGVLPATGFVRVSGDLWGNFRTSLLPSVTLAAGLMAVYQQLLRADMILTLQKDYVLMAKAKGLRTWHILLRHALRPSSFSLVTLAGLNMGRLIGGSVIVEVLFAIPGIGQLMVQSIYTRDFIMLQGLILLVSVAYVAINMLVDLLYTILDPRVRPNAS